MSALGHGSKQLCLCHQVAVLGHRMPKSRRTHAAMSGGSETAGMHEQECCAVQRWHWDMACL